MGETPSSGFSQSAAWADQDDNLAFDASGYGKSLSEISSC
jgi:hypothetical protein